MCHYRLSVLNAIDNYPSRKRATNMPPPSPVTGQSRFFLAAKPFHWNNHPDFTANIVKTRE
jgi:hypothetical protein